MTPPSLYPEQTLEEFFTFLRFPSISADPEYAPHVIACANWLEKYVREIGFTTELWKTSGHPTLFASNLKAGPDRPTLLIYNHYDVQPVDPLEQWNSPPFEPQVRQGEVYARGAQDNKGQCFYTLQALRYLIKRDGSLPVNVKLCIEGEEESGSAGLASILAQRKQELQADYLAIVDVGLQERNRPAVTIGVRGLVTMDVELTGSHTDLHSGSHGGLAFNPIHALVSLLANLRDANGKITVPGFYDQVIPLTPADTEQLALHFDADAYFKAFGAKASGGEKHLTPLERAWLRPTLEINGVSGGYSGPGFKTVIPAKATAKISCRLVPNQDPTQTAQCVAKYLESLAPEGIHVKVSIKPGGGTSVRANPNSPIVQSFAQAYTEVFQKPCEFILEGASIPIVTELAHTSGSEVVLVGLALPDDQIHAPNEHFGVDRLEQGSRIIIRALEILSNMTKRS